MSLPPCDDSNKKKRRIYNKGDEKLSLNGIIKKYDAQWDTEIKEKIKEIKATIEKIDIKPASKEDQKS